MADPQKYRDEADRLRKEAATVDADARETMLDIAKLYERLAAPSHGSGASEIQTDPIYSMTFCSGSLRPSLPPSHMNS
jgi:hypothetical protein